MVQVRDVSQHRSKALTGASGRGTEDEVDRNSKHISNTIRDMMVSGKLHTPLPQEDPEQFAHAKESFFGPTADTPQPDEDVSDYVSRCVSITFQQYDGVLLVLHWQTIYS